jgi:hypothetical protein
VVAAWLIDITIETQAEYSEESVSAYLKYMKENHQAEFSEDEAQLHLDSHAELSLTFARIRQKNNHR